MEGFVQDEPQRRGGECDPIGPVVVAHNREERVHCGGGRAVAGVRDAEEAQQTVSVVLVHVQGHDLIHGHGLELLQRLNICGEEVAFIVGEAVLVEEARQLESALGVLLSEYLLLGLLQPCLHQGVVQFLAWCFPVLLDAQRQRDLLPIRPAVRHGGGQRNAPYLRCACQGGEVSWQHFLSHERLLVVKRPPEAHHKWARRRLNRADNVVITHGIRTLDLGDPVATRRQDLANSAPTAHHHGSTFIGLFEGDAESIAVELESVLVGRFEEHSDWAGRLLEERDGAVVGVLRRRGGVPTIPLGLGGVFYVFRDDPRVVHLDKEVPDHGQHEVPAAKGLLLRMQVLAVDDEGRRVEGGAAPVDHGPELRPTVPEHDPQRLAGKDQAVEPGGRQQGRLS
mmetsp:Transcript_23494/g.68664  ORF Transcript_23494/g.68664 Transcript_23494/m.68664 type:complete len:396 (+) Transcript_23494:1878-3065(+)